MTPNLDLRDIVHDAVQPQRAADNLKISDSPYGGFTTWNKRKVVAVAAPMETGAYARTIRIHETLHANRTAPRARASIRQLPKMQLRMRVYITFTGPLVCRAAPIAIALRPRLPICGLSPLWQL